MEILKFNNVSNTYDVIFTQYENDRIKIGFEDAVPLDIDTSKIQLVTKEGSVYGEYIDYIYVYETLVNGFVLSRIKETKTIIEEETPTVHTPTTEELVLQLESAKELKQNKNKSALANFLASNPIKWTDNLLYGVTQDDQDEMIADKAAYDLKQSLGDTTWKLEWHSLHGACREFTVEEFIGLLNAIVNFVYPYRKLLEEYKTKIYACTTIEELNVIELKYEIATA